MATASIIRPITRLNPGYVSGRFYSFLNGSTFGTNAVGTFGTLIYLVPVSPIDGPFTVSSLNILCITGAASSVVKMALWANDPTTGRPTGTPLVGSNTGQSCAVNATVPTIAVSYTMQQGLVYWIGTAFGTAAPTCQSYSNANMVGNTVLGRASLTGANNNIQAVTAPFTYANDITALDLTGATLSDAIGGVGVPVVWFGAA